MILTALGFSLIGTTIIGGAYPVFERYCLKERYRKRKLCENLEKAFANGDLYKTKGDKREYPTILKVAEQGEKLTLVFNVPKGMNPDEIEKRSYVLKQHFGNNIKLDLDVKRGILQVFNAGLPDKWTYRYEVAAAAIEGIRVPVVCGQSLEGELKVYDMVENPHLLISGETGSGKSSELRSILTTLIKNKRPEELQLILGDLKRSEFHLFKYLDHVEGVYHTAAQLLPVLQKVKLEMDKRGDMLDQEGMNSIGELKRKLPYIIVCIDEVALLKGETAVTDVLEEISSIGRSLGVFLILSMQRPDAKLLDGKLKVNLTVRMGFRTADAINSKIIGTPGAENIKVLGRMILKVNSAAEEIQCPWLDNEKAKKLLAPFKRNKEEVQQQEQEDTYDEYAGVFTNE
ncbi:FtsK/SpoIIIE domain-containing protein [Terribacillus saccharophilus]|uniref:FtsK/SpoIIIE domain-containing protein n=1 Tax=Terribacillus saccharophilus TaxID=361277 RepID=UPI002DCFE503|nr:FtsK/SpoIIIE domain-containing protein [Terribacillus saccharophilus]MEC0288901.1 FtsK/SpoIIIE domain-containing protein [Terribacillus saccharophilus]